MFRFMDSKSAYYSYMYSLSAITANSRSINWSNLITNANTSTSLFRGEITVSIDANRLN